MADTASLLATPADSSPDVRFMGRITRMLLTVGASVIATGAAVAPVVYLLRRMGVGSGIAGAWRDGINDPVAHHSPR
ncbi:MAG: hypothetical protein R2706_08860 [Acidimicrobiales bacterium]